MELSKLKVGDYIKKKDKDCYFQLREIYNGKDYLFEKIVEPQQDGLQIWIDSNSSQFLDYEVVSSIPARYLPF